MLKTLYNFWKTKQWATSPPIQDGDFRLLHPGEPLFQTFSGETLSYRGKEPLYPFFINECAYYEKSIALSLARRRTVVLPPIRVQTEQEQQEEEEQELTSEEEEEREGGKDEEEEEEWVRKKWLIKKVPEFNVLLTKCTLYWNEKHFHFAQPHNAHCNLQLSHSTQRRKNTLTWVTQNAKEQLLDNWIKYKSWHTHGNILL